MKEMLRNCHGHNLSKGNIIKIFYHGLNEITQEVLNAAAGGIFLYKTPNQAYQLFKDKVLLKLDWAKNQKTKSSLKKTVAFAVKDFQSRSKQPNLDDDDITMSREEEAKLMETFRRTCFYNDYRDDYRDHDSKRDNWRSSGINDYNRDNYQSHSDDKPNLQKFADKQSDRPSGSLPSNTQPNPKGSSSKPYQPPQARNKHVNAISTRSGKSYDPLVNPNYQQNNSKTPINFDSDNEDDEPTPQPKSKNIKPVKETPTPKPYKPIVPYPQRLRKEKMEAQYGKFFDMIRAI
ncbi:hypothetical protein Tco_0883696 [Tanacetum coccineum]